MQIKNVKKSGIKQNKGKSTKVKAYIKHTEVQENNSANLLSQEDTCEIKQLIFWNIAGVLLKIWKSGIIWVNLIL